jgi:hypothetical protein
MGLSTVFAGDLTELWWERPTRADELTGRSSALAVPPRDFGCLSGERFETTEFEPKPMEAADDGTAIIGSEEASVAGGYLLLSKSSLHSASTAVEIPSGIGNSGMSVMDAGALKVDDSMG